MSNKVLKKYAHKYTIWLDHIYRLRPTIRLGALHPNVHLAWVSGYPAHYMGEFHCRLQERYSGISFIYMPLGRDGRAFTHENTRLPEDHVMVSQRAKLLWTWFYLECLEPKAVLISGNYPRTNIVAFAWAIFRNRELYYLADSNPLDRRNLKRGWLNKFILGLILGKATKILCIGSRNAEFYMHYFDKEKLWEILQPFPLPHLYQQFEATNSVRDDVFVFLVFGRLSTAKAVDKVISAYSLLDQQSNKRSRLLIAGDGPSRAKLELQVDSLGLRSKVQFKGEVSSDRAPQVFGAAHTLVIASYDEPWGLVVNEALSASMPVIGPFWIGSFADLVMTGKTGIVTRDNSPAELAGAMKLLLENPAYASELGKAGRKLVREQGWNIDGSLLAFGQLPVLRC